jgi:hypothetical protein
LPGLLQKPKEKERLNRAVIKKTKPFGIARYSTKKTAKANGDHAHSETMHQLLARGVRSKKRSTRRRKAEPFTSVLGERIATR